MVHDIYITKMKYFSNKNMKRVRLIYLRIILSLLTN